MLLPCHVSVGRVQIGVREAAVQTCQLRLLAYRVAVLQDPNERLSCVTGSMELYSGARDLRICQQSPFRLAHLRPKTEPLMPNPY